MDQQSHSEPVQSVQPVKKDNKTLIIVAAVVGVLLFCCVVGTAAFFITANKTVDTIEDDFGADVSTKKYSLNENVKVGDVTWRITSAVDEGDTLYGVDAEYDYVDDEVTSGSWITIRGTVTNNGSETIYLSSPDLVDDQDRSFSSSSSAYSWIPDSEEVLYEEIQPGMSYTFTEIYEITSGASGLKLEVTNTDFFNEQKAYVNLGL
jgi:hypothetical protein